MSLIGSSIWEIKRYGVIQYNFLSIIPVREFISKAEKWANDDICYEIAVIRDNFEDKECVTIKSV
jgi:hypothetical protein